MQPVSVASMATIITAIKSGLRKRRGAKKDAMKEKKGVILAFRELAW